jgi:hypothetical protein
MFIGRFSYSDLSGAHLFSHDLAVLNEDEEKRVLVQTIDA